MKKVLFFLMILFPFKSFEQTDSTTTGSDTSFLLPFANPKWRFSTESVSHEKWYFMNSYESKNGDEIKIWLKSILPTFTYKKKIYKNVTGKYLVSFNCKSKMHRYEYTLYSSAAGDVIASDDGDIYWTVIVPDTVFEGLINDICDYYNR